MPNSPRPENPHRSVRVEDELWHAAEVAAKAEGTERAEVMRQRVASRARRRRSTVFLAALLAAASIPWSARPIAPRARST
jgi:hypothetical protein